MFLNRPKHSFDDSEESDEELLYVLPEILGYLEDFESRFDANQKIYSLHFTAIYQILSSVILQRQWTTPPEILKEFFSSINKSEKHSTRDDRDEFKIFRMLALIDKLSLCQ